ncbi:hypothetical protein GCM10008018_58880 [Paenibacillus marchantiophytorum]|uniref:FHA domain-containing protein n=1 Tax=Paenibacillus marchantiophytorum TaxID=1619310 RepID=A0ABQ1FBE2_9BACL|nr:hypothetical protein [Paenibacillus marchantiophytorum]GGA05100.1 hypothetical protein GCM10008018_58880 [Paenibacillus marchantiophytorum]
MGAMDFINQGWIGSFIGALSIIFSIVFYKFTRVKNQVSYKTSFIRLIGKRKSLSDDVDILYKGISVPRLTKSHIVLWNSGTTTVNGNDIIKDDRLRLEFSEGTQILRANIIKENRRINKLSVQSDVDCSNIVNLNFDFLDPNDGAVIELLHTDQKKYPLIKGTIKGIPKGIIDRGRINDLNERITSFRISGFNLTLNNSSRLGVIIFFGSVSILAPVLSNEMVTPLKWFFIILGLIYIFIICAYLWIDRKSSYPKTLRIYNLDLE